MKKLVFAGFFSLILGIQVLAEDVSDQDDSPFCAADAAIGSQCDLLARAWLPLIDQGKYAESYARFIDAAKSRQSLDDWTKTIQLYQQHEGLLLSRKLVSGSLLPMGMPNDPRTFSLQYNTDFAKLKAVEEVQYVQDKDGKWQINSYSILIRTGDGSHSLRPGEKWPDEN